MTTGRFRLVSRMIVDGVFAVCPSCGGVASLDEHLFDAHALNGGVHLVWSHPQCSTAGEVVVSVQDYKHALSRARRQAGEDVVLVESDGDAAVRVFAAWLDQVEAEEFACG